MESMVGAMGARAVQMAYGQVLTGLQTKIIDGAENNWPSYVSTGHYKHARYYTLTEHSMAPEVLVMSKKAWDGLDEADRRIFRESAAESSLFMRGKWRAMEDDSRARAAAEGNVVISDFDRRSFVEAMTPLHEKMSAETRYAPLIRRIRALD